MPSAADDPTEERTLAIQSLPDGAHPDIGETVHLLLVLDENAPPRRVPLHSLPAIIGRTPPADLVLEGASVSRRHCRLELRDERLFLCDLASTNGTYVNGTRLTGDIPLDDGAVIGIGANRLRYRRRDRDEAADLDAMEQELMEAGKYVASILPPPISHGPVRVDWFYKPSTRIGGDAFGYQMLDDRHFALFLLDVSGHGTGAAMHAMTVAQVLRERVLPNVDFGDPSAVIGALNSRFQMRRNNELYFTIWYGVYDITGRSMVFAAGGHHPAWLFAAAAPPLALETKNPVVGAFPEQAFAASRVRIPPGGLLHLFSDGVFEVVGRDGHQTGLDDVLRMLPLDPGRLYERVRAMARPGPLDDDFSALVVSFP